MIGKLARFELKKQLSGPFFIIVLCLLLAVNVLLNCGIREYTDEKERYEANSGKEYPSTFWKYRKSNVTLTSSGRERYALLEADEAEFAAAMVKKYGEDVFDPQESIPRAAHEGIGYFGEKWNDGTMIIAYRKIQEQNKEMQTALTKAVEAAKAYGRDALDAGDNYGIRRNIDIIELYTVPRGKITSPVLGWDDFLFDSPAMLFVYLMVLLACAGSFSTERERKTVYLLHTAKNGKGKTLVAKYLSGAIIAAGLTVLFQAVTLATVLFKEGLLGLSQPAASMAQLTMLSWPMTVWQYMVIQLICQILAAALFSVIVNMVSAVSKSSVISYVVGVLALGLLLIAQSARTEWLMGPLSLGDTVRYFDTYCTANLFGFPVLWVLLQSVLWLVLCGFGIYAANRIFHRKGQVV